ncbi:MAG: GyrI-like domain-containing protein [Acidobacteriota bacterium]
MKKSACFLILPLFLFASMPITTYSLMPLQGGEVKVERIEPFSYFSMRHKGSFTQIPDAVASLWQEAQLQNAIPMGPLFGIYYNSPDDVAPEQLDWEIGFPTAEQTVVQLPLEKKVWNHTQVAVLLHQGPYEKTGETIAKIMEWLSANGYTPAGPVMERYLDMNPEEIKPEQRKTEIWIPCQKTS